MLAKRLQDVTDALEPVEVQRAQALDQARLHGQRLLLTDLEAHQIRVTIDAQYATDPQLHRAALAGAGLDDSEAAA